MTTVDYSKTTAVGGGMMCGSSDCDDLEPCQQGEHVWVGQRQGGPPDKAESAEWVCWCKICGTEKTDDAG